MREHQQPELIEHKGETYRWDGTRLDHLPNKREIAILELKAALAEHVFMPVLSRMNRLLLRFRR